MRPWKENGGPSWVSGRAGRCLNLGEGEGFLFHTQYGIQQLMSHGIVIGAGAMLLIYLV